MFATGKSDCLGYATKMGHLLQVPAIENEADLIVTFVDKIDESAQCNKEKSCEVAQLVTTNKKHNALLEVRYDKIAIQKSQMDEST